MQAHVTRSHRLFTIAAAIVLLGSVPAPAFAADVQRTVAATPEAARQAQRICVRTETTGSRIRTLFCRTRAEWLRNEGVVPGEE